MNGPTMRSRENQRHLEINENGNTTTPNLQDTKKAVLTGKSIALQTYLRKQEKAQVAVLTSNKIDIKSKTIVRDKEGHHIMIKGTIQQEDITLVNIYTPDIEAHKYGKQILMDIKGEIHRNTVIVKDFNPIDFSG